MKLAYFVHDLNDPAVARRVRMLRAGGAEPVVLGFYRGDAPPDMIAGAEAVDLGRTYDGRLGHRAR
ncbi:MAG: glycosyl transferase family 1, partial [Phenylobacterium sp.]|nr:glycosyl transferase family 1 [Phenylobacterium sp.]